MKNPGSILITGGSSGIGAALARLYAGPGIFLALCGRHGDRLEEVAKDCRAKGATVSAQIIDVSDAAAVKDWIAEMDRVHPLDLVIANAGISGGYAAEDDFGAHLDKIFAVNVQGVFNTVHPALALMRPRGRGQIAVMSSIAGFHGLPSSPAYSTSKATVKAYGEALRGLYGPDGIEVNVICPGFVVSKMTARNDFHMPFLMPAWRAARIIRHKLACNRARIAFPFPMLAVTRFLQCLPESWVQRLLRLAPHKK